MSGLVVRVAVRFEACGVSASTAIVDGCATYLELLARWNRTINLTALALSPEPSDGAIDKLVVEPLFARKYMPDREIRWFDLGSGGGSPALPLRTAFRRGNLTMVEARERKCAFLREAVRRMGLADSTAEASRFEAFTGSGADLITFRAVRVDGDFLSLLLRVGSPSVRVISFGAAFDHPEFAVFDGCELPDGSTLHVYDRIG